MPNTVLILQDSANGAIDASDKAITDWAYIENYLIKAYELKILETLSKVPIIKKFVNRWLFDNLSGAYDIYSTFLKCHEEAEKIWSEINEKAFMDEIYHVAPNMSIKVHLEELLKEI